MALRYKFNILGKLKAAGYNTSRLRRDRLLSESTIQKFRTGQMIAADNLDNLCKLLECQPGDILEYVPDNEEK